MKKSVKTLIILVFALALVIAAGVIYKYASEYNEEKRAQEEQAASLANVVSLYDGGSVTKVKIDEFSFTYNTSDSTWTYDEDATFPVSKTKVETVTTGVMNLTADRVLSGGDTMESYGLTEPAHMVTLTAQDGLTYTYAIGTNTSTGTYYVMKNSNEEEIYTCSISFLDYFYETLVEYAQVEDLYGMWSGKTTAITLTFGDKTYTATDAETLSEWDATVGFSFNKMIDYQTSEESKETYGINNPYATIVIHYTDDDGAEKELTIWFGDEYESTYRTFMSSNSDYLYLITISNLDYVEELLDEALEAEEETTVAE